MAITVKIETPVAMANASGGGTISMVAHYFDGEAALGDVTHTVPYFDVTTDVKATKALAEQLADSKSDVVSGLLEQVVHQVAVFTRQQKHAAYMPALQKALEAKLAAKELIL